MQKSGRIARVGVLCGVAALGLVGCANSGSAASPPSAVSGKRQCGADDVTVTGNVGRPPTIVIPNDCAAPTTLIVKDLTVGHGPAARSGDSLSVDYELVTWSNKKEADSSYDRGQPLDLALGQGQVIPGWDQGLVGVRQGGRRLLIIPPDLGYGAAGQPPTVAPDETLVFVTDAVTVAGR
jgi:peptidylprolyl isomerase